MGNLFYYKNYDNDLGDCSKARWRHAARLLPLLLDFVNRSMVNDWSTGKLKSISVSDDASATPPLERTQLAEPPVGEFVLDQFLDDRSDCDEIYVSDANELMRFFAWCDFLRQRDGVFAFYEPLVEGLRSWTHGIDAFSTAGRPT